MTEVDNQGLRTRAVLRSVLLVVAVAAVLYVAYLLRRPLGWLVIAAFVALALSAPVGLLARRMRRGAAIAVVYLAVITLPMLLGALILPKLVREAAAFATDVPRYVSDAHDALRGSELFQQVDDEFDIGARLSELAEQAPSRIGDAAGVLSSIGLGVVNSLFAIFTILILSAFMVANGPRWTRAALGLVPEDHRDRTERALERIATAVSGYVRAQLTIALIAATAGYAVMTILGVPFREPLALLIAFASLIPVIGSALWGITIGLVTLVADFPTDTIVWVIWALLYPQFENYVLQPQLQKRAVQIEPFVIIVAVLFGGTLLGIVGALLAIPAAAAIQIVIGEWWAWRRELHEPPPEAPPDPPPAAQPEPAPAG
ncbi:MAG: AI-2E family transporter [Actinobacteria bacterium]|nr:AI-2E family transporter [Actinomycetota bacterium]